jgi:glutathione S-transferase
LLSFSKGETKTEDFLKRNPRGEVPTNSATYVAGKVPTIQDGETSIYESRAIISYIDEAYPENPIFPKDPQQKAIVNVFPSDIMHLIKISDENPRSRLPRQISRRLLPIRFRPKKSKGNLKIFFQLLTKPGRT